MCRAKDKEGATRAHACAAAQPCAPDGGGAPERVRLRRTCRAVCFVGAAATLAVRNMCGL